MSDTLTIRRGTYRGRPGFELVGRNAEGQRVSVFSESRERLDTCRQVYRAVANGFRRWQAIDATLRGRPILHRGWTIERRYVTTAGRPQPDEFSYTLDGDGESGGFAPTLGACLEDIDEKASSSDADDR